VDKDYCHSLLEAAGWKLVGSIVLQPKVELYWHEDLRQELALVYIGEWVLARGTKHYYICSIGEAGELHARNLQSFSDSLSTLFVESHFLVSTFQDITLQLAAKRISQKNIKRLVSADPEEGEDIEQQLRNISDEIDLVREDIERYQGFRKFGGKGDDLSPGHLSSQILQKSRRLEELRTYKRDLTRMLALQKQLEDQYMKKGEATALFFSLCSDVQLAKGEAQFSDVVKLVAKELEDIHKYQIKQKFENSKLQMNIREADSPAITLLTRWTGAVLNPRQLAKLGPEVLDLYEAVENQLEVFARSDIVVSGAVVDEKKLAAARAVRNFLKNLKTTSPIQHSSVNSPESDMPILMGRSSEGAAGQPGYWALPGDQTGHIIDSGKTGSGKSCTALVIVEGYAARWNVPTLILDPRNQWGTVVFPEDRSKVLQRYKLFDLKPQDARGLEFFSYHHLGLNLGEPLPDNLQRLADGFHILSFKNLDDETRCLRSAEILNAQFDACCQSESDVPRLLIVIEEAVKFNRKGVDSEAQEAAKKAEQSIEQIAREGRKFGIILMLIVQCSTDYSHSTSAVRQNITTRIFHNNSDKEVPYANDWLDDSREIVHLSTGEAYVCNPDWGVTKIFVRPPLSKLRQIPDQEARKLFGSNEGCQPALSKEARAVLELASEHLNQTGRAPRLAELADQFGITSRRKLRHIVEELTRASAADFEHLNERGKPLVITPFGVRKPNINRAQMRTQTGRNTNVQ